MPHHVARLATQPGGVPYSRNTNMPHAILRFRLPEEQTEFTAAMQGADAKAAIWQVDQHCRSILKHGEPSEETRQQLEQIREMLRERPGLLDD
jgi:hypothetical protein